MGQYYQIASASGGGGIDTPGATISPAIEEFASLMASWFEEFPSLANIMSEHFDSALSGFSDLEGPSEAEEEVVSTVHASRDCIEQLSALAAQSAELSDQGFNNLLELSDQLDEAILLQEDSSDPDPSVFERLVSWIKERLSGNDSAEPPSDLPDRFDDFLSAFESLSDQLTESSSRLCLLAEECPDLRSLESPGLPISLEDFGLGYTSLLSHCEECPVAISDELRSKIAVALEDARV